MVTDLGRGETAALALALESAPMPSSRSTTAWPGAP